MSGRIADEVLDNGPEDLTTAERLVLVAIALDARENDRTARFSDVESLVRRTGLKPGTVRNALSSLVKRALITPQRDRVHRGGAHQEYVVARLHNGHRAAVHVIGGTSS